MYKKVTKWLFSYQATPLVLLILSVLSYALFSRSIGPFMDDWYILWFGHTFGAAQFVNYFAIDRPLMGYFFTAVSTLLGGSTSPFVWQILALFLRWLCAYALWGMLNTIWPNGKRQNTWVALLAAVFPGFTQHWIVVVYSFFYACLAGFFFSVTLMGKALHEPKRFWLYYPISVLLAVYSVAASEFYYGLEILRLAFLWIMLAQTHPGFWSRLRQVLKYWSAYLAFFLGFTVWRTFFFVSANHKITVLSQMMSSPGAFLIQTVREIYQAAFDAVVGAWTQAADLNNYPAQGVMPWVIFAMVTIVFVSVYFWLSGLVKREIQTQDEAPTWGRQAFWVGTLALILAILPFWAANLPISNQYPNNRFMLAYLFGSCLWVVAVLDILSKKTLRTGLIIAVLVAGGVGFQFTQGLHYRNIWNQQAALYWQMVWRMPGIQPQTIVMAWNFPNRDYYSDEAIAAQLNWTYANKIASDRVIPYEFVLLSSTQRAAFLDLAPNLAVSDDFRTYHFSGNTSDSLLISYDAQSCLRVLDSSLTPPKGVLADYSKPLLDAADLTDLTLISQTPDNHPPLSVIGREPAHIWCYYFEKAELARQYKQYDQTITLLHEAQGKGFSPLNLSEWYPFLDAYLHLDNLEQARTISQKIVDSENKVYEIGMCNVWSNFAAEQNDPPKMQNITAAMKAISCQ